MNINVKYDIGDRVTWKIPQEGMDNITCSFCNGTKIVQGHDGSTLPCPKCDGRGTVKSVTYREGFSTITGMNITYNTNDLRNYMNGPIIQYYSSNGTIREDYITGIVSEN